MLFKTISSLLCPLPPPPSSNLTTGNFATFFVNKMKTISAQFSTPQSFKHIYIYIYAFSRRFYPKRLTLHSSDSFYILSALAFPGNRTHDLGVANAMLYQLSYRKAHLTSILLASICLFTSFSSLSEAEVSKLILSNPPTTYLLDPISSLICFKPFLLQLYLLSLTPLTHPFTLLFFP